jgi:hypothetical protein
MATFGDIPRLKCRPHAPQDSVLYATAVLAPRSTRSPKGFPRCRTSRFNVARLPATPTRPSRGPWLAIGFCCPGGSSLTTASSAPLDSSPPLMDSRRRLLHPRISAWGGNPEVPQFTPLDCARVPPPIPRWPRRVPMTVASSSVLAFTTRLRVRRSRWSFRGCRVRSELKFVLILRPASWLALLTRTFTFELALAGSPRANVEYDYVGKQSIPTTGLSPASPTALWAAEPDLTLRSHPRGGRHETCPECILCLP